jgi:hypothetical protein
MAFNGMIMNAANMACELFFAFYCYFICAFFKRRHSYCSDNKAVKKTRDKEYLKQNFPVWMTIFAQNLPETIKSTTETIVEDQSHRRARILRGSNHPYMK